MIFNQTIRGGGLSPQIIVTAPTGSTVTATKGSKTLTATEVSGTWTFNVPEFGEWTITATLEEKQKSGTVMVSPVSTTLDYHYNVVYYGLATPLSVARRRGNGVSTGNYALYGGGIAADDKTYYDTVDAYNEQLVRTAPHTLMSPAGAVNAAMAGNIAIFAGGKKDGNNNESVPTAYSQDLTCTALQFSTGSFADGGAVSNGYCAIFGGGETKVPTYSIINTVTAIDETLTVTNPSAFTSARRYFAAANAGGTVLFAGGKTGTSLSGSVSNSVEAYGPDLEKLTATALPNAVYMLGGAEAGNYAAFCGGQDSSSSRDMACAYSPELTRVILDNLSTAKSQMHSTAFQGNALISSGNTDLGGYGSDCYSEELVHTVLPSISDARLSNGSCVRGASVGDYALICGGLRAPDWTQCSDTVDVFTLE